MTLTSWPNFRFICGLIEGPGIDDISYFWADSLGCDDVAGSGETKKNMVIYEACSEKVDPSSPANPLIYSL